MLRKERVASIVAYTNQLIEGVMHWYIRGNAIDCDETRRNINKELDTVLPRVEQRFNLRRIPKVLRVRSDRESGMLIVRMEELNLKVN